MMTDAFGKGLSVGDTVLYSTNGGGFGTIYNIGTIEKFYEGTENSFPKAKILVQQTTLDTKFKPKTPVVYVMNLVKHDPSV